AMVRTRLPTSQQGRALGTIGAGIGLAAALGPPLGGIVVDLLGWRWIFAANLLVLVPGLVWTWRLPVARGDDARRTGRFDVAGAGLLLATLVLAALAGTVWRVEGVPGSMAVAAGSLGVVAAALLRRHASRAAAPVLDFGLLRRRAFLAAGLAVAFVNLTMYTVLLAVPVFLTQRAGWTAG
ncbi:MAG: MFS transporter, partial [Trueperaceae bacterium]|nr:MFS transporter [Trueperaceae bacterium]